MKHLWVVIATFACALPSYGDDVWVQVRESRVRRKPLFYASTISAVRYGDKLSKVSEENGWIGVRVGSQQGYLPLSAVSPKAIVFSTSDVARAQADSTELVLAGKGFNKATETSYKGTESGLRYDLVDRVEREARASSTEVARFVKQGGLK